MVFDQIPKTIGFIYGLVMIFVIAYLWYSGRWRQKIGWLLLVISAATGISHFCPGSTLPVPAAGAAGCAGSGGSAHCWCHRALHRISPDLLFGRFFCGYLCPVGAVQEIAYHAPVPKINPAAEECIHGSKSGILCRVSCHGILTFGFVACLVWHQGFLLPLADCRDSRIHYRAVAVHDILPPVLPPCLPVRGTVIARCMEEPFQITEN